LGRRASKGYAFGRRGVGKVCTYSKLKKRRGENELRDC